jgi:hypothetical protein
MSPEEVAYRKRVVRLVKEIVEVPATIRYAYLEKLRKPGASNALTDRGDMLVLNNLSIYDDAAELHPAPGKKPAGLQLVHSRPAE